MIVGVVGVGVGAIVGGDLGLTKGTKPGGNVLGCGGVVGVGVGFVLTGVGVFVGVGVFGTGRLKGTISGLPGISILLVGFVVGLVGVTTVAVRVFALLPMPIAALFTLLSGLDRENGTALLFPFAVFLVGGGGSRRGKGGLRIVGGGGVLPVGGGGVLPDGGGLFGKKPKGGLVPYPLGPPISRSINSCLLIP